MKYLHLILTMLMPLCAASEGETCTAVAQPSVPGEVLEEGYLQQQQARRTRSTRRNVGRAAQQRRRQLREQGVRNVRAQSPSGWPTRVPVPDETTLQERPKQGQFFVYETNNYIFYTPVQLDPNACETVGRLFECAFAANQAVGEVVPVPRTEADRSERKYRVDLWPTMAQYYQNGGPQNSAGVYAFALRRAPDHRGALTEQQVATDRVIVPFPSLGLDAQGRVVRNDIETHTLVHELTHQNFVLNNLPIWMNEGWAEYIGSVPYVGEDLDFTRCYAVVLHRATERASQGALDFPFTLEQFLTMSQEEMYSYMPRGKDTYTLATMLVTFFVHMDGKRGVEALKKYMQAILDGESPAEAAQHLIAPHRTAELLQRDFIKAWRRKRVEVGFAEVDD